MQYNTSELTEEQRIFQDMMTDFADEVLAPMVDEAEETGNTPWNFSPRWPRWAFCVPAIRKTWAAVVRTSSPSAS